jgi:hypothetical protein
VIFSQEKIWGCLNLFVLLRDLELESDVRAWLNERVLAQFNPILNHEELI